MAESVLPPIETIETLNPVLNRGPAEREAASPGVLSDAGSSDKGSRRSEESSDGSGSESASSEDDSSGGEYSDDSEDSGDYSDSDVSEDEDDSSDGYDSEGSDSREGEEGKAADSHSFEYPEVIDGASRMGDVGSVHAEDLGGESVQAATAVAGVAALSAFRGKRYILLWVLFGGVTIIALYFIWHKIREMKSKINLLEQQLEMGLNDKDVEVISAKVLEDYLLQEAEETGQHGYSLAPIQEEAAEPAAEPAEDRPCLAPGVEAVEAPDKAEPREPSEDRPCLAPGVEALEEAEAREPSEDLPCLPPEVKAAEAGAGPGEVDKEPAGAAETDKGGELAEWEADRGGLAAADKPADTVVAGGDDKKDSKTKKRRSPRKESTV